MALFVVTESRHVLPCAEHQSLPEADLLHHFMAGEETFVSMAALEAAVAKDVAQCIDTCHLRASPSQDAHGPASRLVQHPGQTSFLAWCLCSHSVDRDQLQRSPPQAHNFCRACCVPQVVLHVPHSILQPVNNLPTHLSQPVSQSECDASLELATQC